MNLGFNTYVYEVAGWPIEKTLKSAGELGFRFTEYAACGSGDPTKMSASKRKGVLRLNADLGLYSSQVLLAEVEHMAHPDPIVRTEVLEYMKYSGPRKLDNALRMRWNVRRRFFHHGTTANEVEQGDEV